ncbi:hypothetical protein J7E93_22215 [Streptomyces sp. ISL-36]|uniref:hypothetical protein n=1 Tax=Streptomyces sp. ISL-36 TaxID=2819182 RepID=UPI001BEC1325|nr:hypothetical protein [Streptomyces sp. ISL-36]MBT2442774.1 hypothetical protein [Streptomyces sp. ISL-36]
MRRSATARSVFSILAAVLVALQLLTPTTSFASAHTARHAVAKAHAGINPSGQALRAEIATCPDADRPGDPTGPLRTRDRQRTADNPGMSERPSPAHPTSAAPEPATPGSVRHHAPRSSRSHSAAALQVFRC